MENITTVFNLTDRSINKSQEPLNELKKKEINDNIYLYRNKDNYFLSINYDNKKVIKNNPSLDSIKNILKISSKKFYLKNNHKSSIDSILNSLNKMNFFKNNKNVDFNLLKKNIHKIYKISKNPEEASKNINANLKNNKQKYLDELSKGGSGVCKNLPKYSDLPSYKDTVTSMEKILLPLEYTNWFWKKMSCTIKPWICPLAPIFCIEEYLYEAAEDSDGKFWKVLSWIIFIIIDLIDLALIFVGEILDLIVPGAGMPLNIVSIVYSFLRLDILGVFVGFVGLIPYIGASSMFVKALREITTITNFFLKPAVKAAKKTKILLKGKYIVENVIKLLESFDINDIYNLVKLGSITENQKIIKDFLKMAIKDPKKTISIINEDNKNKFNEFKKTTDNDVLNLINNIKEKIGKKESINLVESLKKVKKNETFDKLLTLSEFGKNEKSQEIIKWISNNINLGKKTSIKELEQKISTIEDNK